MSRALPHPVVVADIGGTNCRIASVAAPGEEPAPLRRVMTGDYPTVEAALTETLTTHAITPRSAVLAVAGPLDGRQARLTNAAWAFDGERIAAALGLEQGLLVNDFEALAASLPGLKPEDLTTLAAGQPELAGTALVLGPGTGFGCSALVAHRNGWCLVPSEAGHIGLGPEDPTEAKLWPALARTVPRVTVEALLSGDGLVRLHRAVAAELGSSEPRIGAADIGSMADDGDPVALMAVVCFWRLLARVAGDLALAFKATGGVHIAGGIAPKLLRHADRGTIAAIFAAKPPMQDLVARIGLHVVTASDAAERGLAAIAAGPSRFGLDDSARLWRS